MLHGKHVLVGVTGSIAAYKSAELVRSLVKAGAIVKVVMTPDATDFITPLTLSVLSRNPVLSQFSSGEKNTWNNHVELGIWADLFVVAPVSANTIAKMAGGICDNLLMAVYLSSRCPVYVAPAMDVDMFHHGTVQTNLKKLSALGVDVIPVGHGELASGLHGDGRMEEPENILKYIEKKLKRSLPLAGKKILVTAGPTYEAIDPVRFIGNHSSGNMGFAIAEKLAQKGAEVILVTGPTALRKINSAITSIDVVSADEMYTQCVKYFPKCNAAIMSAAVADYAPAKVSSGKLKKSTSGLKLELKPTKDILATLGKMKKKSQLLVGFALETDNEKVNAQKKIRDKKLDFIILNSLRDKGAGFSKPGSSREESTNKVSFIDANGKITDYGLKTKVEVASDIADKIIAYLSR